MPFEQIVGNYALALRWRRWCKPVRRRPVRRCPDREGRKGLAVLPLVLNFKNLHVCFTHMQANCTLEWLVEKGAYSKSGLSAGD